MLSCDLSTFDSWSVRWDVTRELWFILVEEDVLPFLRLSAARNQENVKESEFPSMTESRSRAMGTASQNARFNITDVFSAPSFTCVTAAENFIEGNINMISDHYEFRNVLIITLRIRTWKK
ncbi:hypothetical protein D917_10593 [Trichinella nativa]|uniref:Uncharacterized protein n=1 Tax=Trichinella nativa TaxID=6335 RepID=A0A1Y3EFK7_9BILA|nr:hypothetical protein D917_10593 [Trichinella nativa]